MKKNALKTHTTAPDSIRQAFANLCDRQRESLARFRPTLSLLEAVAHKLQAGGLSHVGIEQADLNKLRECNVVNSPASEAENKYIYSVLSIYDARFLIRVTDKDGEIHLHQENRNKANGKTLNIADESFWNSDGYRAAPRYFAFRLGDEKMSLSQTLEFINVILQTAAACAVHMELKDTDVAPKTPTTVLPPLRKPGL